MNIEHEVAGIQGKINLEAVKGMTKTLFVKTVEARKKDKIHPWAESLDGEKVYDQLIAEYDKRKKAEKEEDKS